MSRRHPCARPVTRPHMPRSRAFATAALLAVASLYLSGQGRNLKPVTEAMLENPDANEWLNWRRTLDGWGYSPLNQINKNNVNQLQLVWSWGLAAGQSQPTPLVHDGMMFVPSPGGGVQAIDAVNGDPLWEFKPPSPEGGGARRDTPTRNLAIFGDKIFVATGTVHLIALNAQTGKVVWDHPVADPKLGYNYTSGPIIAKGVLVQGITGCERYKEDICFITGHDPETGRELWRTSTVARPGEPGGETWEELPLRFRAGGDAWIPGSYDPKTGLIYWGTAQAKPWAQFARGTKGDALYTNSTLALDPSTGKIQWYYQHLPGETHDMDETFERVLVDLNGRSSVFTMGKLAILWEIDRKTGKFVAAHDLGYQNILDVDQKTGKVTYRPNMIPVQGKELMFCPDSSGFKSLRAMAYHPDTKAFYIPLNLACERGTFNDVQKVLGGGGTGAVRRLNIPHPESPEALGEFLAMDAATGKVLWRHRTRTPPNTGALTTGGGLVFEGNWNRYLYAYDAVTGKILYQTRLPTSIQGYPITYSVNGKQYVAVPVGTGGGAWQGGIIDDVFPDEKNFPGLNSIFVFALPDSARK
jgi:PQQ-dependent dehydrogenase (methanol/ethanol family)